MAPIKKKRALPGVLCIGEVPGELRQPTHISAVSVSGDGRYVVTTDGRGVVRLFDAAAGTRTERKPPFKVSTGYEPTQVVMSADATTVAIHYGYAKQTWILPVATFGTAPGTVTRDYLSRLAISPDGATVACSTMWGLTLIDAATGTPREIRYGGDAGAHGVGFLSEGGLIAAGFRDRRLRLVDASTGAWHAESEVVGPDELTWADVAVRPDGTVVAALHREPVLLEWDGRSATVRRRPIEVPDLAADQWEPRLLPAAGLLAVRLVDDRLALLDLDSGRVRRELPGAYRALAVSADGGTLAVTSGVVVDLHDGASLERRCVESGLATTIDTVAFEPDGGALWTVDRTSARRWTVPDAKPDLVVPLHGGGDHRLSRDARMLLRFQWTGNERAGELVRLPSGERHELTGSFGRLPAISPDGRLACGVSDVDTDGPLLWDTATGLPIGALDGDDRRPPYYASAFSPSGHLLAAGAADLIRIWDVASGSVVARFSSPGKPPWSLDLSADGKLLAFGSDARPVYVVALPSGRSLHVLDGHTRRLTGAIAFAPDSTLLASSDGHDTRLWNARTGLPVAVARVGAEALAFSPDGRYLAAGGHGLAWIIEIAHLRPASR